MADDASAAVVVAFVALLDSIVAHEVFAAAGAVAAVEIKIEYHQ